MKLFLTKGMFGNRIEEIGSETIDVGKVLDEVSHWKKNAKNRKLYKIEPYDRLLFGDNSIAIDFGDYFYFFEVTDVNDGLKDKFKGV